MFCFYYTATVTRPGCWYLVAVLRSFEHLAFDRTIDKENSVFEFFVPEGNESDFLEFIRYFQEQGIVTEFKQLPNRLADPNEVC